MKFLESLASLNIGYSVKIRYSKNRTGSVSLFLEHYVSGKRTRLYPGLVLYNQKETKHQDEASIRVIISLRQAKENAVKDGRSITDSNTPKNIYLIDYANALLEDKKPKNRSLYLLSVNRFLSLYPDIIIQDVSEKNAYTFLKKISDLTNTTQRHYIRSLSYICNAAVKEKIINSNPFADIKIKLKKAEKHYLTVNEIKSLIDTDCDTPEVKKAFIFSCFTGIRIGDIQKLETCNIKEGYLYWQQNKTGSFEKIKLPDIALDQIDINREGKLFLLPAYKTMRLSLKCLIQKAGIAKPVTFHSARHTFATMCLSLGIDIYTVSKLLGHADVRVTQVYAKLVDETKDKAASLINQTWLVSNT